MKLALWLCCGALLVARAPVARALPQDELEEHERALRDREDASDFLGYRSRAVRELASIGTPEAWELVLEALLDPAPRCADEAQLRLGELRNPEVLEDLFGKDGLKSRELWVRLRVAEALGRMTLPIDARELASAFDEREAEVRRSTVWSVERLAQRGGLEGALERRLVPALDRLARRDRDGGVAAAALWALRALQPVAPASLDELLPRAARDERVPMRCAAAALVGRAGLDPLLADESFLVRTAAARRLSAEPSRENLLALCARLEAEPELRLRWRIVDELQRLSGLRHRLDARPWSAWAESLPEDWAPEDTAPTESAEQDAGGASFAGMPVLSTRVALLIDCSGSLWQEREGGRTRKAVVDEELRRALEALPEDARFNLIPYANEPHPWRDELVPARERNVSEALAWFEGFSERGKGNVWDALMLAMQDPEVDTLILLTDGAPSGGQRWNLELMVPLLLERDRHYPIAIDVVLVDSTRKLARYWSELATNTGGHSIEVELR